MKTNECPGCGHKGNHFRGAPNGGIWACQCGAVWSGTGGVDWVVFPDRHEGVTDVRVTFKTRTHMVEMAIEHDDQLSLYADKHEDIDPAAPETPTTQLYSDYLHGRMA